MTWIEVVRNRIRDRWRRGETFTLAELYQEIPRFRRLYPNNLNIEAKIRQVLQWLRDEGEIAFVTRRGKYRRLA